MSRLWAGVGAAAGVAAGGASGAFIGSEWASAGTGYFGPPTEEDRERALKGAAIGAIIVGALGAALGAGSSAPKQIGVGVGHLPSNMGGGMFP